MQPATITSPPSPPPPAETPERKLLRELADQSHRNGMALIRKARAIREYLDETDKKEGR